MDTKQEELYIGIDLGDDWTQISYYRPEMKEPETISVVAGEERYRIPTTPYKQSLSKGQTEEAQEMLQHFLRKVIRFTPGLKDMEQISAITIHLDEPDPEKVDLLKAVMEQLGISKARFFVQDSKESFRQFVINQEKELKQHDVMMFLCEENELYVYRLTREDWHQPREVTIQIASLGTLPLPARERDQSLAEKAEAVLHGKIVSAVYLMGDGLEGGWLKESLHVLCRNRKAFQGKNLFTKGACYQSIGEMQAIYLAMKNMDEFERGKVKADRLLADKKYLGSIQEYQDLLQRDEEEEKHWELTGDIWHNIGVAYARMFLFAEAAEYFLKAYKRTQRTESLQAYEAALRMQEDGI